MVKKKKILFFVYCLLVSALSIGWYPQNQNKQGKERYNFGAKVIREDGSTGGK